MKIYLITICTMILASTIIMHGIAMEKVPNLRISGPISLLPNVKSQYKVTPQIDVTLDVGIYDNNIDYIDKSKILKNSDLLKGKSASILIVCHDLSQNISIMNKQSISFEVDEGEVIAKISDPFFFQAKAGHTFLITITIVKENISSIVYGHLDYETSDDALMMMRHYFVAKCYIGMGIMMFVLSPISLLIYKLKFRKSI